ncbi:hypothetical protein HC231_03760 [Brenneria izadpanahii]|uniref:Uncharacterized protein n=1 Tax=Brenneria izadpanahii TaxID=2722756 RepID=A0ABX7UU38_9GAMM|nr:hypothetical protein [Brenneria izadpanahii]QTF07144.1 hypothetical protein HC231_03760 [Brenneria izadpanahii]
MSFLFSKKIEITAENAMFKGVETALPSRKAVIQIKNVEADHKLSSSVTRSPSLISGYPDPVLVEGKVLSSSDAALTGKSVSLRLSKQEWERINAGVNDAVGIGIVDTHDGYGLICLENLSSRDDAAKKTWLASDTCRKRWDN